MSHVIGSENLEAGILQTVLSHIKQVLVLSLMSLALVTACLGQSTIPDKGTAKALEAAAAFCQSLTQWTFVIIGGSLLAVVGTSYYRPAQLWIRSMYILFLPSWIFLARSIYFGIRTQEAYVAYLLVTSTTLQGAAFAINQDAEKQIWCMELGLLGLSIWLVLYLIWWIFEKRINLARGVS
jgi:hypothetical protein